MDNEVRNFIKTIVGSDVADPEPTPMDSWVEKVASLQGEDLKPDSKKSTEEPMISREDLNNLSVEELAELALGGTEKTAEEEMENAQSVLSQVSAYDMLMEEHGEEKVASELSREDIEALKEISAWDYLVMEGEEMEKEAGEEGDYIDPSEISLADAIAGLESGELVLDDLEKEASDEDDEYEQIDPSQLSLAEFEAGIESGEIVVADAEKTAGDEPEYTEDEIAAYHMGLAFAEGAHDGMAEKTASLEDQNMNDEDALRELLMDYIQEKTASDEDLIDPNQISLADFVAGVEAGEIEVSEEDLEKMAGVRSWLTGAGSFLKTKGQNAASFMGNRASMGVGFTKNKASAWASKAKNTATAYPKTMAAIGATGLAGAGGGGYAVYRRKKRSKK